MEIATKKDIHYLARAYNIPQGTRGGELIIQLAPMYFKNPDINFEQVLRSPDINWNMHKKANAAGDIVDAWSSRAQIPIEEYERMKREWEAGSKDVLAVKVERIPDETEDDYLARKADAILRFFASRIVE